MCVTVVAMPPFMLVLVMWRGFIMHAECLVRVPDSR